jgi:predicted glutamine amidotransferase
MNKQVNNKTTSILYNKTEDLIIMLNTALSNFPSFEKYGIQSQIRTSAYDVLCGIIECEKRYQNKTSLTKLDVRHEQLRCIINISFKMGYFHYKNGKTGRTDSEAIRIYSRISLMVDEIGRLIGFYINQTNSKG